MQGVMSGAVSGQTPMMRMRADERKRKEDAPRKAAMRAFFKRANAEGFDTSPDSAARMRRELALFLGKPVYSRADLSAGEWIEAEAGLWVGLLAW